MLDSDGESVNQSNQPSRNTRRNLNSILTSSQVNAKEQNDNIYVYAYKNEVVL